MSFLILFPFTIVCCQIRRTFHALLVNHPWHWTKKSYYYYDYRTFFYFWEGFTNVQQTYVHYNDFFTSHSIKWVSKWVITKLFPLFSSLFPPCRHFIRIFMWHSTAYKSRLADRSRVTRLRICTIFELDTIIIICNNSLKWATNNWDWPSGFENIINLFHAKSLTKRAFPDPLMVWLILVI